MSKQPFELSSQNTLHIVYGVLFTVIALAAMIALVVIRSSTDTATSPQSASVTNVAPTVDTITASLTSAGAALTALDLTANSTVTVHVYGAATDNNGCADISATTAWKVALYRTDVAGGSACTPNNLNCYNATVTAPNLTGCTTGTGINYDMTMPVQFYADATIAGSSPDHAATTWTAFASATDVGTLSGSNTSTFEINTLKGVSTSGSVAYGTLAVNGTSAEKTITLTNTGNYNALNPLIKESTPWACTIGTSLMVPSVVKWNITTGLLYATGTAMTGVDVATGLSIAKSTTGTASTAPLYTMLKIPATGVGGSCTDTLTVTGN